MNKDRSTIMWVHPAFKKKMKMKALELDKSLTELTAEIGTFDDPYEFFKNDKKKFRI